MTAHAKAAAITTAHSGSRSLLDFSFSDDHRSHAKNEHRSASAITEKNDAPRKSDQAEYRKYSRAVDCPAESWGERPRQ